MEIRELRNTELETVLNYEKHAQRQEEELYTTDACMHERSSQLNRHKLNRETN